MNDPQNHIRSRLETITTIVRQIAEAKELSYDLGQLAASAIFQLSQLEAHLANLREPADFVRRRTYRGFQSAILPHGQTVEIPAIVDPGKFMLEKSMPALQPDPDRLTFDSADKVPPAPPIGTH